MNIKPRTAFITIGAVIGLIILGQATKHDQPTYAQQVAAMTPAEQKKEATFQRWKNRCGTDLALQIADHPKNEAYLQSCLDKIAN